MTDQFDQEQQRITLAQNNLKHLIELQPLKTGDMVDIGKYVSLTTQRRPFSTEQELNEVMQALDTNKNPKYRVGVVAFYEMKIAKRILDSTKQGISNADSSRLTHPSYFVEKAKNQGKLHIGMEILTPSNLLGVFTSTGLKRFTMPYRDVESVVKDFISNLSCPEHRAALGCLDNCVYQLDQTQRQEELRKHFSCDEVYEIAFAVLNYCYNRTHDELDEDYNPNASALSLVRIREELRGGRK